MRKEIIAVKIPISRQGQQFYFTVNLPKDAVYVAKVETGVLALNGSQAITAVMQTSKQLLPDGSNNPGNLAGTLQLQSMEQTNLCYTADVTTGTSDLNNVIPGFLDDITFDQQMSYAILPFVAAQKQQAEQIRLINNNCMLYGYYHDEIGLQSKTDLSYTVGIYLHLVINS